jgi:hypothetical protein
MYETLIVYQEFHECGTHPLLVPMIFHAGMLVNEIIPP